MHASLGVQSTEYVLEQALLFWVVVLVLQPDYAARTSHM